jgi:2-phospho-L-lactate/phosphoenolpyruvate guanylyltransferase
VPVHAVLPVKRFDAAKTRLAADLPVPRRIALAGAMAADVLDALRAVAGLDDVIVVSGEPAMVELAAAAGARVLGDDDGGHSQAAAAGAAAAAAAGADRVLLVPGDCPALDPQEIAGLLAAGPAAPSVVVVPDRHGTGTNALLLDGPAVIAPAFGPGSHARHLALARAAGADGVTREVPSLAFDVDTADDLAALAAALADRPGAARRTRAELNRIGPA